MNLTDQERDEWLVALRDPNRYKQIRGALVRAVPLAEPLRACCIGVKADVVTHGGLRNRASASMMDWNFEEYYKIAGMIYEARNYFMSLNDRHELTFEEIALVIENVPEEEWYI